ncbi:DUF2505 domain-containing protein [Georgenia yuyongxinii]|uniref:DUF2505 domain-containing protein n=1 Tax=Georgenia yuyongxinii TaxID=2589797 RepID=A0A5B8C595_9MICO|nr:DUF2505 domain-containing protein [Georgenia yuyongxinii]QDC25387.1 DUF2505 domain-containing protein [Georgenia yuyongxinii]
MHFSSTIDYPADVEAVAAMLADPEFVARKAAATGALESHEEVVRDGEAFTVTTRLKLPTTMVPAKFRSLVGEAIEVVLIEAWAAPAANRSRSSTLSLDIHGVPVRVSGTQHLAASGAGTTETYDGEVKASIPLFGRPIEQAAVDTVGQVVDVERRIGLEYLTAR